MPINLFIRRVAGQRRSHHSYISLHMISELDGSFGKDEDPTTPCKDVHDTRRRAGNDETGTSTEQSDNNCTRLEEHRRADARARRD